MVAINKMTPEMIDDMTKTPLMMLFFCLTKYIVNNPDFFLTLHPLNLERLLIILKYLRIIDTLKYKLSGSLKKNR